MRDDQKKQLDDLKAKADLIDVEQAAEKGTLPASARLIGIGGVGDSHVSRAIWSDENGALWCTNLDGEDAQRIGQRGWFIQVRAKDDA